MKQKILITGGAGFIGQHLVRILNNKYNIIVLDNLLDQVHGPNPSFSNKFLDKVDFVVGDINDSNLLEDILNGVDYIVHLAAETGTAQSMYNASSYITTNCSGTSKLIDILINKKIQLKRFILASSRSVYGEGPYKCPNCADLIFPEGRSEEEIIKHGWEFVCPIHNKNYMQPIPVQENHKVNPQSIYAASKLMQEDLVRIACNSVGIDFCNFRFQNVYGPGQSLNNPYTGIISIFYNLIMSSKKLDIYEDGNESRDFVYVDDVCLSIIRAIECPSSINETINIGSGERSSVLDVANAIYASLEINPNFEISGNYRVGDIRHNVANNNKLESILQYRPSTSLKKGIQQFIEWAENQHLNKSKLSMAEDELKSINLFKKIKK